LRFSRRGAEEAEKKMRNAKWKSRYAERFIAKTAASRDNITNELGSGTAVLAAVRQLDP
jgi:hypothetical protein